MFPGLGSLLWLNEYKPLGLQSFFSSPFTVCRVRILLLGWIQGDWVSRFSCLQNHLSGAGRLLNAATLCIAFLSLTLGAGSICADHFGSVAISAFSVRQVGVVHQPFTPIASTEVGKRWTARGFCLCLSLVLPPWLALVCPHSDVSVCGSFRCVCRLSRGSFVDYSYPTCNCKKTCRSAHITMLLLTALSLVYFLGLFVSVCSLGLRVVCFMKRKFLRKYISDNLSETS